MQPNLGPLELFTSLEKLETCQNKGYEFHVFTCGEKWYPTTRCASKKKNSKKIHRRCAHHKQIIDPSFPPHKTLFRRSRSLNNGLMMGDVAPYLVLLKFNGCVQVGKT